jgi:phospho-N-acetylmuramoyl-pentapeptide-transferase
MLYYLSQLGQIGDVLHATSITKGLNVFQYISFRALCAGLTSFLLCLLFGNMVIRRLSSLKFGQPIRSAEEVHRLNELHGGKKGTPTMGGILIIGAIVISTLLWARPDNPFVLLALITVLYLGALGFYDDWLKVVRKNSDGISSRLKFVLQCVLAGGITAFFLLSPALAKQAQEIYMPFVKGPVLTHIGGWTFVFYLLIIVGSSNAVNLTDGLDGLASGCTVMAGACFGVFTYLAGNFKAAAYLQVPYFAFSGELAVVSLALAGAALGFLWWNCHPARVFMGDTGSLAIGGLLGVLSICCKQELLLAIVGGVFVAEAMSVILQVASFKLTGRRIFKMSPLHHHFELSGWKENTVTVRFWILAIVFGLLGIATLKLR